MANLVDIVVLAFLSFYFAKGLLNGFLRTLIGPLSLVGGTFFAFFFYQKTHDFMKGILISIVAPVIIGFTAHILLNLLQRSKKDEKPLSTLSRLGGGALSVIWSGLWVILLLIFVAILPGNWSQLKSLKDYVVKSGSYTLIDGLIGDKIPSVTMSAEKITEILQDPEKLQALEGSAEYQDLMNDPAIQNVLSDQDILKDIKERNISKLLTNQKFLALAQDEALLKKIFSLHEKMTTLETAPAEPVAEEKEN